MTVRRRTIMCESNAITGRSSMRFPVRLGDVIRTGDEPETNRLRHVEQETVRVNIRSIGGTHEG